MCRCEHFIKLRTFMYISIFTNVDEEMKFNCWLILLTKYYSEQLSLDIDVFLYICTLAACSF